MITTGEIVKGEMKSQKKKMIVAGIVAIVAVLVLIVFGVVKYSSYRDAQELGIQVGIRTRTISISDPYEKQCAIMYAKTVFSRRGGYSILGTYLEYSDNSSLRSNMSRIMTGGGYDSEFDGDVANYFKYSNFFAYFKGYYWRTVLPIVCYFVVLLSVAYIIDVLIETKKQLLVYEDSVVCKSFPRKTKEFLFGDISNVDLVKNKLKVIGLGFNFQISNLANADEIVSAIMDGKKTNLKPVNESMSVANSSADEIKKYSELYENGIITKEEFEAKKKQILGI